ncbi:MAG TPA: acetylornithine deacetylase [Acidimicrobiales bacterium]|nr:acetylornithine deacetylase [Acidimicrobiales bacterium]
MAELSDPVGTVEILEKLVAFDTTSSNANQPLIEWVVDYLDRYGINSRVDPGPPGKANLIARLGPPGEDGIVLCGHTDVVPVEGQPWTKDPFRLTREGTRLYGRGTADMKGFIASALAVVPALAGRPLQRPVTLALTYDEEVGCRGAPSLAEALHADGPAPALVITGEPTRMSVVRSHKGIRVLRTTVIGREGHSSRPDQSASAIMAAARIVGFIEDVAAQLVSHGVSVPGFAPRHTTMNVGTISGGTALNIVPRSCDFVWEYRAVPGEDVDSIQRRVERFATEEVLPTLLATALEASITTEVIADVPALDPSANQAGARFVRELGGLAEGDPVAYGTDGAVLQGRGLPTVICGPGSMEQGHQPDEFIEQSQLELCDSFMARLAVERSNG